MVDQLVAMVQARSLAEILKTVTFQLHIKMYLIFFLLHSFVFALILANSGEMFGPFDFDQCVHIVYERMYSKSCSYAENHSK